MPSQPRPRGSGLPAILLALVLAAGACTSGTSDAGPSGPPSSHRDDATDSPEAPEPSGIVVTDGSSGYSNRAPGYFGNPIWATGPGNIPVAADNELAIRFVAREDGRVERVSFIIKYDFERPGYHGGDCGELEVTLRPDALGVPADDVLARMTFPDPCGGERTIGWLTDQPWDAPVDVIGGDTYHLVFSNLDPDPANFVSVNMLYRPDDRGAARDLSTGNGRMALFARGSAYWSGSDSGAWGQSAVLLDHLPAFELHYDDGTGQGVSYVGARFDDEIELTPTTAGRVRQVFTATEETTLTGAWFRGVQFSPRTALSLVLAEKDGALLYTGSLPAPTTGSWFGGALPTPLTLEAGTTYTAEIAATAGSVLVRPLYQAAHDDWTSTDQSDWEGAFLEVNLAGAWAPYVNEIPHDLSLYFDRTAPPPAADDEDEEAAGAGTAALLGAPPRVAVYGDSLVSEPAFDELLGIALDARSFVYVGKDSESGRNTQGLLEALASNPMAADVYLVNIGINGEETAEEYRSRVEQAVAAIRAINPDADILWSSLHALPVKFDYIVDARVDPRNAVLAQLAADGAVTLVPWAEVAARNPQIYRSDGVHFFGNEQLYVSTVVEGLDRWSTTRSG